MANFKLLTIICEPVLRPSLLDLVRLQGATGFTVTEVSGEGNGEKSSGEVPEAKSKIEVIAEPSIAMKIMEALSKRFFENYSIITYSSDIAVLRAEKFEKHSKLEDKK